MQFDEIVKYAVWIIFLGIALIGLYFLLKRVGVL
jgi:hypothetical protein